MEKEKKENLAKMLAGVSNDYLAGGVDEDVLKMQIKFAYEEFFKYTPPVQKEGEVRELTTLELFSAIIYAMFEACPDYTTETIIGQSNAAAQAIIESTTEKQEPDSVNVSQKKEENPTFPAIDITQNLTGKGIGHESLQEPRQTNSAEEFYQEHHEFMERTLTTKAAFMKGVEFALQSVPERPEQKEGETVRDQKDLEDHAHAFMVDWNKEHGAKITVLPDSYLEILKCMVDYRIKHCPMEITNEG